MSRGHSGKILITGATGFLGGHLAQYLRAKNLNVETPRLEMTSEQSIKAYFAQNSDVTDVVHLAGLSNPRDCERQPDLAYQLNATAALWCFRNSPPSSRFIAMSTAQLYAGTSEPQKIDEKQPVSPAGVYGRTKLACEELLISESKARASDLLILRLFNHTHKSQKPEFFMPKIYQALHETPVGRHCNLRLGSLDIERDFSTVFDFCAAIEAILAQPCRQAQSQVFNLASGSGKNLRQLVVALAEKLERPVDISTDPALVRAEAKYLIGDNSLFGGTFDWQTTSGDIDSFVSGFLKHSG